MQLTLQVNDMINYKPVRNGKYQVWDADGWYLGEGEWRYTHWIGYDQENEAESYPRYWAAMVSLEVD